MSDAQRPTRAAKARLIPKSPEERPEFRTRCRRLALSLFRGVAVSAHGCSGNLIDLDLGSLVRSIAEPQYKIGCVVPHCGGLDWIAVDGDLLVGRCAERTVGCMARREEEVRLAVLAPPSEVRRGAARALRAIQSPLVFLALVFGEVREGTCLDLRTLVDPSCLHRSPGRSIRTGVGGISARMLTVLGRDPMRSPGHLAPGSCTHWLGEEHA